MNENINKVIYGTTVLVDLTQDTVSSERMFKGDTAHGCDGSLITGTAEVVVNEHKLVMPIGLISI